MREKFLKKSQFSPPPYSNRFIPYPQAAPWPPSLASLHHHQRVGDYFDMPALPPRTKFRGNSLYQKKQQIFWDQPDHSPVLKRTEIAMEKNHTPVWPNTLKTSTQQLKFQSAILHRGLFDARSGELFVVVLKMFATKINRIKMMSLFWPVTHQGFAIFKTLHLILEPQTTIYKWMFGKTTIFYIKIWNHPIETTIYKWLFGVPGYTHTPQKFEKWPYLKPETTFSKATIIFFVSSR